MCTTTSLSNLTVFTGFCEDDSYLQSLHAESYHCLVFKEVSESLVCLSRLLLLCMFSIVTILIYLAQL